MRASCATHFRVCLQASNVLGSKGPRKMKVVVPRVNQGTNERVEFKPMGKEGEMAQRLKANDLSQMVYMINKPPRWNEGASPAVAPWHTRHRLCLPPPHTGPW